MKMAELAFACYIYGNMTDYDDSYLRFVQETQPSLNLNIEQHRIALIKWLNDWGCRQFAIDYHNLASRQILDWFEEFGHLLFPVNRTLLDLSESDFLLIHRAYANLVHRTASMRGGHTKVEIGPTGTAKILFALRPNALIPWDEPMRKKLILNGSASHYEKYLNIVRRHLEELSEACITRGHSLSALPRLLNRPTSSLVKLIDEYHWVTISRKCPVPSSRELEQWAEWW